MTTLHRRLLIALLVLGLGAYIEWRAGVGLTDFDDFHGAASRILETGSLSPPGKLMRYPPSFMILMWPLGLLPLSAAVAVFYLLSVAALLALPGELERLSGIPWRGQWPAWLVMLPLIVDNLVLGQSGPVLLYLVVAGTARSGAGRALAGGFLIG
ncbi:MAG TPA: glycosyltransferase family 87 protein, partial [Planctomycetota bacterium]|nr:glycosyltransferase family 87 protein [Planctomycetota bacterium]